MRRAEPSGAAVATRPVRDASPRRSVLARLSSSTPLVKIAGGVLVLGAWEIVVRLFAPAYVARPSSVRLSKMPLPDVVHPVAGHSPSL